MGARLNAFFAACLCFFIMMPTLGLTRGGVFFAGAPAAAQEVQDRSWLDLPVEKLVVGTPRWQRGSGLVYGTMAFTNGNEYPVKDVIMGCDFFDERGNWIGTKATVIQRVISPGRTKMSGIYFTLIFGGRLLSNAQAGACRIISAKRFLEYPVPTS